MSRKHITYFVVATIISVLINLALRNSLFTVQEAQAQCVAFKFASSNTGSVSCGSGWVNISEVESGNSGWRLALCAISN